MSECVCVFGVHYYYSVGIIVYVFNAIMLYVLYY